MTSGNEGTDVMRIVTFLLEIIIVLLIIVCLYQVYFNTASSGISNNNKELITNNVKGILNNVSNKTSLNHSKKDEQEIEKEIDNLMEKYNIN